jgi:hypothetical protein
MVTGEVRRRSEGRAAVPLWIASAERSARATLIGFCHIVDSGPMRMVIHKTDAHLIVAPDLRIL